MRTKVIWLLLVVALLAGCGDDDDDGGSAADPGNEPAAKPDTAPNKAPEASGRGDRGTRIVLGDSEFGSMLFDADDQAIYIFENDGHEQTVCYGDCAEDWPPVLTEGEPQGEKGVDDSLLGTVKRRDGSLQVTYGGQPLYFYAHEDPGEVRCHNVNLNGGLWWAVAPDGERLP
jgi:predicted lipoprotein with Yx(FWY)xxD motif